MLRKFSGSILYVLISLLVVSLYLDRHESLEKLEMTIQDTMFMMRGKTAVADDIVIVGIDNRAIDIAGKWPWNRDKLAHLVAAVAAQDPKTIVLDMTLSPDDNQRAAGYTDSLAKTIARAGNVVFGFHYSQNDPTSGLMFPSGLMNSAIKEFDDPSLFSKYPPLAAARIYPPDAALADSARSVGFINVNIDNDRKIRWQPLVVGFRGEFFPSIQVAAAASYLGLGQRDIVFRVGSGIAMGKKVIPTDRFGQLNINYNGPAGTFKTFSAADLLDRRIAPHEFSGKLVIIGYAGAGTTNIYGTPMGSNFPGVELNATIIENIIHGNTLRGTNSTVNINLVILLVIGILCALILPKISLIFRIIVLAVTLIITMGLNYFLFAAFDLVAKTFYPALEIAFFLVAAPILKTNAEAGSETDDDDEEDEVDYETLLSSGQNATPPQWSAQPQQSRQEYEQTVKSQGTPTPKTSDTFFMNTAMGSTPLPSQSSQSQAPRREREYTGSLTSTLEPPPTDHFGRYRILRAIGKGAMGNVYQGLDPAIDRPVALKTIRVDQGADPQETEDLKERLMREAKAAGKISHPNIVTIYDVGEENGMQYIAMEYLEGQTLENLLKRGLDWDYRAISKMMIQACEALDYAHENGIVHRDIKPANIMIMEGQKVKVMDFGIARLDKSASMTQTGTALGTPNYISPEQLKGMPIDRRSDIFSLGVVFYEILTREKPFKGDTISALIYSILHTDPPRPSELNLDIPRIFDKIIAKALVKDPDLRFQRAKDIADILRKLI
jgi:serine/threonine-protein kinase